MNPLFRKNMEPSCAYCRRGEKLNAQQTVCKRYGVVSLDSACRAFVYDPLKRVPPPQVRLMSRYTDEDFTL